MVGAHYAHERVKPEHLVKPAAFFSLKEHDITHIEDI